MAFWLYSSGSTGKPKGVVHLQHDIEFTCDTYARQVLGLREDDVNFSTTKLFHAYGLGNASRSRSGSAPPRCSWPARRARRAPGHAARAAADGLLLRARALRRCSCATPAADGAFDSVRLCVSAAEALPPQTAERLKERFGLDIIDGIGSTEMLHIYCSNRPGGSSRDDAAARCRATSCASSTRSGTSSRGRRSAASRCAATPARRSTGTSTRRPRPACAATGSRAATASSGARTAPTSTSGGWTTCSRSAGCGSRRSTWSTCCSSTRGPRPSAWSASRSRTPAGSPPSSSAR